MALHRIVFTGPKPAVPSPAEIEKILGFELQPLSPLPSPDHSSSAPAVTAFTEEEAQSSAPVSPSALEFAARIAQRRQQAAAGNTTVTSPLARASLSRQ